MKSKASRVLKPICVPLQLSSTNLPVVGSYTHLETPKEVPSEYYSKIRYKIKLRFNGRTKNTDRR